MSTEQKRVESILTLDTGSNLAISNFLAIVHCFYPKWTPQKSQINLEKLNRKLFLVSPGFDKKGSLDIVFYFILGYFTSWIKPLILENISYFSIMDS